MVNIDPNKDDNYVHDIQDPMDNPYPPAWLGCVAGLTIALIIIGAIILIIIYGG